MTSASQSIQVQSEIKAQGPKAKFGYERALKTGHAKMYRARIMLIGQNRAGKTSLKKSLLGLPFDPNEQSTDGIEIDPWKFEIDVDQVKNWQRTDENLGMNLQSDDRSTEHHITLDLWDFTGQHLYYASYPVFLSSRAVYVLVYNLSKGLNNTAKPILRPGRVGTPRKNPNRETNLENLLSWLVSVSTMSLPQTPVDWSKETEKDLSYLRPPVFIVGTHADKPVEDINTMKQQILEEISGKHYACHVVRPIVSIDNTQGSSSDGIRELQKRLIEVLKEQPYMGEELPVRWFNFEKVVEDLVAKNSYYLNLEQLKTIIQKDCFIDNEDEVATMLKFYHDLGKIVKHGSTVVLRSEWLINLFKKLITIRSFEDMDPKHEPFWKEMRDTGVLRKELVDDVFAKFCQQGAIKEDILNMMEQFGLIVKFESSLGVRYYVPSQLSSPSDRLRRKEPSPSDPCPLYIHFPDWGFVPHGLYSQLVSKCAEWCSGSKEEPIFCDTTCSFIIRERSHELILFRKKRFIKIILKQTNQEGEASSSGVAEVGNGVRRFLEDTLQKLKLPWLRNLRYEFVVQCPYCPEDTCRKHGRVFCSHEDCMCIVKVQSGGQLGRCLRCGEIPTLPGLKKLFSTKGIKSGSLSPVPKFCKRKKSVDDKVKEGIPSSDELQELSVSIGDTWRKLGRRLSFEEGNLAGFDHGEKELCEKAYAMLLAWKQRGGSDATYLVLYNALCHSYVSRKDLGQEVCCCSE